MKGGMVKKCAIALLALAAIAVIAWFAMRPAAEDGRKRPSDKSVEAGRKGRLARRAGKKPLNARERVRQIVATESKGMRRRRPSAEMFANLRGRDRALAETIQKALDDGNYDEVIKSVDAAMASDNAEVRSHLVDALGWFGVEALPELTVLMADQDDDVAESAQAQWVIALADVENAGKRMEIGLSVLATLSNENMLADVSGEVSNAALEYIDGDSGDSASQDERRVAVVQALLDIIDGDRPACSKAAKETYEEITGNEWLGVDEAERYLRNPDGYEPPDMRGDDSGSAESF